MPRPSAPSLPPRPRRGPPLVPPWAVGLAPRLAALVFDPDTDVAGGDVVAAMFRAYLPHGSALPGPDALAGARRPLETKVAELLTAALADRARLRPAAHLRAVRRLQAACARLEAGLAVGRPDRAGLRRLAERIQGALERPNETVPGKPAGAAAGRAADEDLRGAATILSGLGETAEALAWLAAPLAAAGATADSPSPEVDAAALERVGLLHGVLAQAVAARGPEWRRLAEAGDVPLDARRARRDLCATALRVLWASTGQRPTATYDDAYRDRDGVGPASDGSATGGSLPPSELAAPAVRALAVLFDRIVHVAEDSSSEIPPALAADAPAVRPGPSTLRAEVRAFLRANRGGAATTEQHGAATS